MQQSPIKHPAISKCSRCGRTGYTQHLVFKQNVSYFFGRKERQFSGDLCFSCASITFARVEFTTLLGTWWGIIGFWLGPLYVLHNLVEYIIATFHFVFSEKYVWNGLLRLWGRRRYSLDRMVRLQIFGCTRRRFWLEYRLADPNSIDWQSNINRLGSCRFSKVGGRKRVARITVILGACYSLDDC